MMGKYWFPNAEFREKIGKKSGNFVNFFDISSLKLKKLKFLQVFDVFLFAPFLLFQKWYHPTFGQLRIKQNVNVGISEKGDTGLSKTHPLMFDIFIVQIYIFLCRSTRIINLGYIWGRNYAISKF